MSYGITDCVFQVRAKSSYLYKCLPFEYFKKLQINFSWSVTHALMPNFRMTSSLGTHPRICSLGGPEHILKERSCKISCFRYTDVESSWKESFPLKGQKFNSCRHLNTRKCWSIFSAAIGDANDPDGSEDNKNPPENETGSVS